MKLWIDLLVGRGESKRAGARNQHWPDDAPLWQSTRTDNMRGTMSNETPSRIETTSDCATRLEKGSHALVPGSRRQLHHLPHLHHRWILAVLPSTCYYINMESARHRRRRMDVLLARHGLKAHRVRATTPQDERFAQQLEKCASQADVPDRHAETVPPPLRANTLSHVEVWRSIAACPNEDEATLVLEDDVMLLHTWRAELAACLSSLPADWQLFMLDSLPIEAEWYFADGCAVAAPTPLNAAPYGKVLYLDAYVLRPSGARWLLERHEAYPRAGRRPHVRPAAGRPLVVHPPQETSRPDLDRLEH